jgi:hypothetical protein
MPEFTLGQQNYSDILDILSLLTILYKRLMIMSNYFLRYERRLNFFPDQGLQLSSAVIMVQGAGQADQK